MAISGRFSATTAADIGEEHRESSKKALKSGHQGLSSGGEHVLAEAPGKEKQSRMLILSVRGERPRTALVASRGASLMRLDASINVAIAAINVAIVVFEAQIYKDLALPVLRQNANLEFLWRQFLRRHVFVHG